MNLLGLLAAHGSTSQPVQSTYPYPEGLPYNVKQSLVIPTYDGSGSATHPSVVDMGPGGWNGYRFWMGMTPYNNSSQALENPSIIQSHDGITWRVPDGLTNPLRPWSGGDTWQSDIDIEYDPDTGRMWAIWRESAPNPNAPAEADLIAVWGCWSTNGYQWSTPQQIVTHENSNIPAWAELTSPSLVRVAAGDWWMFSQDNRRMRAIRATAPDGTWSTFADPTIANVGQLWHVDVNYEDGIFHALINDRDPWCLRASTSTDGATWTPASVPLVTQGGGYNGPGSWDAGYIYRATMTPHGDVYNVWYGATNIDVQWGIGHTRIPKSYWTA